jgi:hypothetical protein
MKYVNWRLCSLWFTAGVMGLLGSHASHAQTVIESDYIYIGVEAEDAEYKNERWVLTEPGTPTLENDPDGNHSDQASGSKYLELLPDIRVTHDDPMGPPTAYWGQAGTGPDADYVVNFPEAGRYYVHARAYSTGTEDNGIHFGINGTWPVSSRKMQFCSAGKRAWWWSSAQRDAGGNGACGTEKTIWLDIEEPGEHTVSISAREDGFELDRFVLLKDLSNNTRICSPVNVYGVNCRNGSIGSADEIVDMQVRLRTELPNAGDTEQPDQLEVEQGSTLILSAQLENLDAFDTANDVVFTLSPVAGEWEVIDMDDRCTAVGDEYECSLDNLHPTAPDEYAAFVFTLSPLVAGELRIDGSVLATEVEEITSNNAAATIVSVLPYEEPTTDLKLDLLVSHELKRPGEAIVFDLLVKNLGEIDAQAVEARIDFPAGMKINESELPVQCLSADVLICSVDDLSAGAELAIPVEVEAETAGVYIVPASVIADNDNNSANNLDSNAVVIAEPEMETDVTGGTDAGNSDAGQADGGNTSAGTTGGASDAGDLSDTGSIAAWCLLALMLVGLTRLYGWHQRQRIVVRQQG